MRTLRVLRANQVLQAGLGKYTCQSNQTNHTLHRIPRCVNRKKTAHNSPQELYRIHRAKLTGNQPPRILEGHTLWVTAVALSRDGKRAVSGSYDHTLRVWDMEGNQPPRVLEGHTGLVYAVALSADGKRAVSIMNFTAPLMYLASRPSRKAIWRA